MIGVFSHILESVDLTNAFKYYHGEPERKGFNPRIVRGGWDEELYSKDIDTCIKNDSSYRYTEGKDKYILHLYTMGEDYSSIYLGSINVRRFGDNKFDWEWNEQEPITQEQIGYLRDEVQKEAVSLDTFNEILEFNDKLNKMKYKMPSDFENSYHLLRPTEFISNDGGVCWDYVTYEADYFKKKFRGVKFKTFFYEYTDKDGDKPDHTFLIFEYNKLYYWFESSWKQHKGIYKFNTENDALNYIIHKLTDDRYLKDKNYRLIEYNATDNKLYGSTYSEYIEYMNNKSQYSKFRLSNTYNDYIEKMNNQSITEACKDLDTARKFVYDVGKLAKKYDANYFIVTDGASGTSNSGNECVRYHRDKQIEWEKKNGFDPDEDWSDTFKESSINEATRINNKGEAVPEVCPKCGSKVNLVFRGEPIWLCNNKDCEEYFGVKPFKENAINEYTYDSGEGFDDYILNGNPQYAISRYKEQAYSMSKYIPSFTLPDFINKSVLEKAIYDTGEKHYHNFWSKNKGFQVQGDSPFKFFRLMDCHDENLNTIVFKHAKGFESWSTKLYQYNIKGKRKYSRYTAIIVTVKEEIKAIYVLPYDNDFSIKVPIKKEMYSKNKTIDESSTNINDNSHIYYNKNNISEDDESMLVEGYIKNQPDLYYNKDKFDSGEINLCFITGLSGSGKSTMGRNMANDKVEHYELDDVIWNKESFTMENFKEYGDLIYSFFKGIGKKYYCKMEELQDGRFKNYNYEKELINTFINYAIKYAKSHKDTKFVIEGVWIYFYVEPELIKDYAVYIKGTSMLISKIRAAKRDTENDHKDNSKIKNNFIAFKSIAFKRWEEYLEGEKYIKKYRDYFTNLMNKTVEESAMFDIDDNIPDIPFLCSYNISGLAMDILNELSGPGIDDTGADTGDEENFDMPTDGGEGGEDPDPTNNNTNDTGTDDNNMDDENYDVNDDTEGDDTGEEDTGENNEEENPEGGEEDENFDLPEDGDGEIDTTGGEDEGLNNGNNDTAMDGGLDQTKSKLQEIEDQIFDDLTDVDKANKTQELKKLFMDLHANCTNIIEMVDDMPKNEDMLKITEFINKSLEDTKQYILDYISNTFDSKSYMENMAEFQKYIAVLYSIRNVLDELKPKTSK